MTLVALQAKLGEQIELVTDKNLSYEERKQNADIAMTVSSVAKQMINNADVILRHEKLISDGKLENSRLHELVG
jgi:hypothetical protein